MTTAVYCFHGSGSHYCMRCHRIEALTVVQIEEELLLQLQALLQHPLP